MSNFTGKGKGKAGKELVSKFKIGFHRIDFHIFLTKTTHIQLFTIFNLNRRAIKYTEMFLWIIQRNYRKWNFEFLPSRSDIGHSRSNLEIGI